MIDDERTPDEPNESAPTPDEAEAREPLPDAPEGAAEDEAAQPAGDDSAQQPAAAAEEPAEDAPAEGEAPAAEAEPAPQADAGGETPPPAEEPVAEEAAQPAEEAPAAEQAPAAEEATTPRVKPEIPGADLEVDIVPEGVDPFSGEELELDEEALAAQEAEEEERPIAEAAIDLAAGARYKATGKRKTAVARVILKPGTGAYEINGRTLDEFFPRPTLQRNIRQPLEAVGYESRMDVIARLHGGGVSAQAGALRHGISRALLEADPNLRGELKRRGFLTRDARVKERKKAGLKKARKRPQFSKR